MQANNLEKKCINYINSSIDKAIDFYVLNNGPKVILLPSDFMTNYWNSILPTLRFHPFLKRAIIYNFMAAAYLLFLPVLLVKAVITLFSKQKLISSHKLKLREKLSVQNEVPELKFFSEFWEQNGLNKFNLRPLQFSRAEELSCLVFCICTLFQKEKHEVEKLIIFLESKSNKELTEFYAKNRDIHVNIMDVNEKLPSTIDKYFGPYQDIYQLQ